VIVYIGAISVLILFAIMLTQTKDAPRAAGLPDPVGSGGRRPIVNRSPPGAVDHGDDWGELAAESDSRRTSCRASCSRTQANLLPFEVIGVLLLAAVIGGRVPGEARAGRPREQSLDAYLILSTAPLLDRHVRVPRPAQRDQLLMSIELMLTQSTCDRASPRSGRSDDARGRLARIRDRD
jgi:hypothetical protein